MKEWSTWKVFVKSSKAVKEIPVIVNGDVTTPEAAGHMIEKTGCHGVSAGRGALQSLDFPPHPAIPGLGHPTPEPSFEERIRVMCRHYDLMVEVFGKSEVPAVSRSPLGTPNASVP